MSNKSIIFLIAIILSCSCIFASKEWNEIECTGIDDIVFDVEDIRPFSDNLNHYFFKYESEVGFVLYKFEANKNTATLKNCDIYANYIYSNFWSDGNYIYHASSIGVVTFLKKINIKDGHDTISFDFGEGYGYGTGFMMNNKMFYLDNQNGKLHDIVISGDEMYVGSINIIYSPIEDTSIAVLNNTWYYFSSNGFVASTISDRTETDSKLIEKVNTKESESTLLTDGDSKIWIINKSDGVIEYNTKNNTVETIAKLPNITRIDESRGFFYSQNMIYLLDCNTKKVYTLDVSGSTPPTPGNGHDQSGKTCGCLGFEFIFVLVTVFTLRLFKH